MAIPLKRAKRRAQRARRRAHQHAPQADWVVWDGTRQLALSWHLRIDTEQFQQQLQRCGSAPQDAANAMHRVGDVGVETAATAWRSLAESETRLYPAELAEFRAFHPAPQLKSYMLATAGEPR